MNKSMSEFITKARKLISNSLQIKLFTFHDYFHMDEGSKKIFFFKLTQRKKKMNLLPPFHKVVLLKTKSSHFHEFTKYSLIELYNCFTDQYFTQLLEMLRFIITLSRPKVEFLNWKFFFFFFC